jgi:hypothetical protein
MTDAPARLSIILEKSAFPRVRGCVGEVFLDLGWSEMCGRGRRKINHTSL